MKKLSLQVQDKLNDLKWETRKYEYEENGKEFLTCSGLKNIEDLEFILNNNEHFKKWLSIDFNSIIFLSKYYGFFHDGKIEISITRRGRTFGSPLGRHLHRYVDSVLEDNTEDEYAFSWHMNYFNNDLKIYYKEDHSDIFKDIFSRLRRIHRRFGRIDKDAIVIEGYNFSTVKKLEEDLDKILTCICSETYFIFGLIIEPNPIFVLQKKFKIIKKQSIIVKNLPVEIIYKEYNPELFEYIKSAESVRYPPFRFLSFFQIIEYCCDRSTYKLFSNNLKEMMLKPDFHFKIDEYLPKAIKLFRSGAPNIVVERKKIFNVLKEFIDMDDFKEYSKENLSVTTNIIFSNKLEIPKIKFDNVNTFLNTLTTRIYKLRNSIVHSNPDFDEERAKPLIPTRADLYNIEDEIELIKYVANQIIQKSIVK
jgi:hypothetical protein